MMSNDFNAFYKPYLLALKINNIFRNQFKYNSLSLNIVYCMIFLLMVICIFLIAYINHYFIFIAAYTLLVFSFYWIDKKVLKNCVKVFRKKHTVKFLILSPFEQLKYYLWKEELKNTCTSFSIKKALSYLELELNNFNQQTNMKPEYLLVLSGVTLVAFWRLLDDLNLINNYKIITDAVIFYVSYRLITLRFYIFTSKKKKLLEFKQCLLRLKAELS